MNQPVPKGEVPAAIGFLAILAFFLWLASAVSGCGFPDLPNEGPLCDQAETLDWAAAARVGLERDPKWALDPGLEAYLEAYGMAGAWLAGGDLVDTVTADLGNGYSVTYNCEFGPCLPVSPRAKMLSSLELLATEFPGWQTFNPSHPLSDFTYYDRALKWFAGFVWQDGTPQLMACGSDAKGRTAINYRRPRDRRQIVYFAPWFSADVTWRTGLVVHEVAHSYGYRHSAGDSRRDHAWGNGAYMIEALYLVALSVESENEYIRHWAEHHARNTLKYSFVIPTTWTVALLQKALQENGAAYFIRAVPTYEPRPEE